MGAGRASRIADVTTGGPHHNPVARSDAPVKRAAPILLQRSGGGAAANLGRLDRALGLNVQSWPLERI
jgi:hypothetical protein